MASLSAELGFFVTPARPCSYLEDKETITLFVDPRASISGSLYSSLSAIGFRRSGAHIYRPYCQSCAACIPIRIPVEKFALSRAQRRTLKRNQDLVAEVMTPRMEQAYYDLYSRYIVARHSDGDMYPPSPEQFQAFLVEGRPETRFVGFRLDDRLVMLSVVDLLDDGMSAIYTCFDPDLGQRSLGTFSILWLIEEAVRRNLTHIYIGYWIRQCQKMSYKVNFRPFELLINNRWIGQD